MIELIQIDFYEYGDEDGGEGEAKVGLYLNGEIVQQGDYYHDKIYDRIEGFLDGVARFSPYTYVRYLMISEEDYYNISDSLSKYDLTKLKKIGYKSELKK